MTTTPISLCWRTLGKHPHFPQKTSRSKIFNNYLGIWFSLLIILNVKTKLCVSWGSALYSADDRRTEMFWKSLCVFVLLRTRANWTWWESGQFYSSTSPSLKLLFSVKSNHELLWQVQIKQRTMRCSGTWIFAFMVSCWLYLLLLRYIITLHSWCGNKDAIF